MRFRPEKIHYPEVERLSSGSEVQSAFEKAVRCKGKVGEAGCIYRS